MSARLTFCSGAGTVTGANFLLELDSHSTSSGQAQKILVDCGALQEGHTCDPVNAAPFPYDPRTIEILFVTHAHQDHIGRIPKLVRDGFKGRIISTFATKDLAAVMLDDALRIMQEHAEHFGCEILYERADVTRAFELWEGKNYRDAMQLGDLTVELEDAGHILGSAMVRMRRGDRSILFTGDLGNMPEPLLRQTDSPAGASYILIESVYGDRVHEGLKDRGAHFQKVIAESAARGGTLLIPSFSLERTQVLLYEIHRAREAGALPVPVFLDAPLATRITEVFRRYSALMNDEAQKHFDHGDPFSFPGLSIVRSSAESAAIHREPDPKIIIAGAGMSAGGRIRGHEKALLESDRTTVLFVGYQAPGTLGRRIEEGQRHIKIDGTALTIRARIEELKGYSGHADREELLDFLEKAAPTLEHAFVVMGEPKASQFLAQRAHDFLGIEATAPQAGESVSISL